MRTVDLASEERVGGTATKKCSSGNILIPAPSACIIGPHLNKRSRRCFSFPYISQNLHLNAVRRSLPTSALMCKCPVYRIMQLVCYATVHLIIFADRIWYSRPAALVDPIAGFNRRNVPPRVRWRPFFTLSHEPGLNLNLIKIHSQTHSRS